MGCPSNTGQFCLQWNNHHSNMVSVFGCLLERESFVDVTLACEGLSIKAHKMVLSSCSPFFQNLFLENPCPHPIVILKDMRYSDLEAIVSFMYRGEVNVSQTQLSALLKAAETLQVKGLAEVADENQTGRDLDEVVRDVVTNAVTKAVPRDQPNVPSKNVSSQKRIASPISSSRKKITPSKHNDRSSEIASKESNLDKTQLPVIASVSSHVSETQADCKANPKILEKQPPPCSSNSSIMDYPSCIPESSQIQQSSSLFPLTSQVTSLQSNELSNENDFKLVSFEEPNISLVMETSCSTSSQPCTSTSYGQLIQGNNSNLELRKTKGQKSPTLFEEVLVFDEASYHSSNSTHSNKAVAEIDNGVQPYFESSGVSDATKVAKVSSRAVYQMLGDSTYQCLLCLRRFHKLKSLECHHYYCHVQRGSYKCINCRKTFSRKSTLIRHASKHAC